MRGTIWLAAILAASFGCVSPCAAQPASDDYYRSTTIEQFVASCENNDDWCRSTIAPRIELEGYRFCVPADHNVATNSVMAWLRANRNTTLVDDTGGNPMRAGDEYLAKGIRSAMGNMWREMGKACPFPQGDDSDDDFPF